MSDLSDVSAEALWWAVIVSGLYHGLNPGMGWPLAVSAAMMERRPAALIKALAALAVGHFASMTAILLPFAAIAALVDWERPIRLVSALVVTSFGAYLLINRRHPRFLSRVPPHRLGLWSFLVATAHGAGLMLLPVYLALNDPSTSGDPMAGMEHTSGPGMTERHASVAELLEQQAVPALAVAGAHTLAMVGAGAIMATVVYRWLGLRAISRTWFNLDLVWAASLVLVGLVSGVSALLL